MCGEQRKNSASIDEANNVIIIKDYFQSMTISVMKCISLQEKFSCR